MVSKGHSRPPHTHQTGWWLISTCSCSAIWLVSLVSALPFLLRKTIPWESVTKTKVTGNFLSQDGVCSSPVGMFNSTLPLSCASDCILHPEGRGERGQEKEKISHLFPFLGSRPAISKVVNRKQL